MVRVNVSVKESGSGGVIASFKSSWFWFDGEVEMVDFPSWNNLLTLSLFVLQGPREEASCLELSQETTSSSYSYDSRLSQALPHSPDGFSTPSVLHLQDATL